MNFKRLLGEVHLIFYKVFLLILWEKGFLSFPTPIINYYRGLTGKKGKCGSADSTMTNTHIN